jgi:hypothetical protein
MQDAQPLGRNLNVEKIDAGRVAAWPREAGNKTELDRSSPTPKTIGIVAVAALAASAAGLLPGVAITATRRRTRSAMSDGRRSYWPASQWYSTVAFWPSMVPVWMRPLRNAVT